MRLKCLSCEEILTQELSSSEVDICEEDGKDFIPVGYVTKNEDWAKNEWIVNSKDIINTVITDEGSRLNGCCDLDGCDGPNLKCSKCGEYVATARYDCWMPKHVVFNNDKTSEIT